MTDTGIQIRCIVNGAIREAHVPPRLLLSDFLRHDLGLTGTHVGATSPWPEQRLGSAFPRTG